MNFHIVDCKYTKATKKTAVRTLHISLSTLRIGLVTHIIAKIIHIYVAFSLFIVVGADAYHISSEISRPHSELFSKRNKNPIVKAI